MVKKIIKTEATKFEIEHDKCNIIDLDDCQHQHHLQDQCQKMLNMNFDLKCKGDECQSHEDLDQDNDKKVISIVNSIASPSNLIPSIKKEGSSNLTRKIS